MENYVLACPLCGLMQRLTPLAPQMVADCCRCGSRLAKGGRDGLARTAALSLAALFLYVPANIYPILRMDFHGIFTESTVLDGCIRLARDGQWLVAAVVFLASMVVPLLKLCGLFYLVTTTRLKWRHARPARTRIYKIIDWIGPWAMLDVFLLAILVGLVKLGRVATVTPGPGLPAFAALVILTMLATACFDPREIWEPREPR